jgi:ferredoxin
MTMELREAVQERWPELEVMIGWGWGFDPLHSRPLMARRAEDIAGLIWSPFCVQNLTGYLVKPPVVQAEDKSKKVGICVRGCDSRSLVALIQEKLVTRDQLLVFGLPCPGTLDWRRLALHAPLSGVKSARLEGELLLVEGSRGTQSFTPDQYLARRCLRCAHPSPLIHDVLVGGPVVPRATAENRYGDIQRLEEGSLPDRLAFWQEELDRCIRCYACRNACPLCICQDRCIAETRDPKWLTQAMGLPEKFLFHFIHALHLAGRCTECGECERVCPMEIPVALMKEKLGRIVGDLMGYEAGLDPEATPPLLTFSPAETGV